MEKKGEKILWWFVSIWKVWRVIIFEGIMLWKLNVNLGSIICKYVVCVFVVMVFFKYFLM